MGLLSLIFGAMHRIAAISRLIILQKLLCTNVRRIRHHAYFVLHFTRLWYPVEKPPQWLGSSRIEYVEIYSAWSNEGSGNEQWILCTLDPNNDIIICSRQHETTYETPELPAALVVVSCVIIWHRKCFLDPTNRVRLEIMSDFMTCRLGRPEKILEMWNWMSWAISEMGLCVFYTISQRRCPNWLAIFYKVSRFRT